MPVTVIAMVTIAEEEPAALAHYLEVTAPLLERAQAKIVKRFTVNEVVVGLRPAASVIIVEYPDRASVDMVFESKAYRDLIPTRDRAFEKYHVSVVEQS